MSVDAIPTTAMKARFDFKGARILVTGATSGIGHAVALTLRARGAQVYASGRDATVLDALSAAGCTTIALDLADAAAIEPALAGLPPLDGLVNCAGVTSLEKAVDLDAAHFDFVMGVNARGAALVGRSVARAMIAAGKRGSVVNVSSQAALVGMDDHLSYWASKAAMDAMTRVWCVEWGRHGIRVNSVNPTVTLTPMAEFAWSEPAKRDPALAAIPLGRFAQPSEVVEPILFLLSDAASMISGVTLAIDGGYTSR
jgi:L-xylulose reductase